MGPGWQQAMYTSSTCDSFTSEVITVVKFDIVVWVVMPCSLVGRCPMSVSVAVKTSKADAVVS